MTVHRPYKYLCNIVHGQALVVPLDNNSMVSRDETIWRYIDTVSIHRLTIRIVAQRDISRYDLDICYHGKSPRCLYFLYLTRFSYSFKKYNLCGHCLCKMPVEMDL